MSLVLDHYLLLAPLLLAAVVGLLAFVGCDVVFRLNDPNNDDPITFVQLLVDHVDLTPVNAVVAPFPATPVTAGNLIVVWIWYHTSSGQTISSVTDSAGTVYEPADQLGIGQGAFATGRQQIWYAKDALVSDGTPGAITVTFTGTVEPSIGVGVFEYSNPGVEPLLTASHGASFGHDVQSPDVPTTGAKMLFGAVLFSGEGTHDVAASLRLFQRGNIAEDYVATPLPAQIRATATNPENQSWIAQLVAFK